MIFKLILYILVKTNKCSKEVDQIMNKFGCEALTQNGHHVVAREVLSLSEWNVLSKCIGKKNDCFESAMLCKHIVASIL